jgi:hypothetical protein
MCRPGVVEKAIPLVDGDILGILPVHVICNIINLEDFSSCEGTGSWSLKR